MFCFGWNFLDPTLDALRHRLCPKEWRSYLTAAPGNCWECDRCWFNREDNPTTRFKEMWTISTQTHLNLSCFPGSWHKMLLCKSLVQLRCSTFCICPSTHLCMCLLLTIHILFILWYVNNSGRYFWNVLGHNLLVKISPINGALSPFGG